MWSFDVRSYLGSECCECLDKHSRLDRHVEATSDACTLQHLDRAVLLADRHQAGHLILRDDDFLAASFGEGDIGCVQK